jgi:ribonuclease HI
MKGLDQVWFGALQSGGVSSVATHEDGRVAVRVNCGTALFTEAEIEALIAALAEARELK